MPVSKERMRELQRQRRLQERTCEACGREASAEHYHQAAPELRAWAVCTPCLGALTGLQETPEPDNGGAA